MQDDFITVTKTFNTTFSIHNINIHPIKQRIKDALSAPTVSDYSIALQTIKQGSQQSPFPEICQYMLEFVKNRKANSNVKLSITYSDNSDVLEALIAVNVIGKQQVFEYLVYSEQLAQLCTLRTLTDYGVGQLSFPSDFRFLPKSLLCNLIMQKLQKDEKFFVGSLSTCLLSESGSETLNNVMACIIKSDRKRAFDILIKRKEKKQDIPSLTIQRLLNDQTPLTYLTKNSLTDEQKCFVLSLL
jgi:hypothetical protein